MAKKQAVLLIHGIGEHGRWTLCADLSRRCGQRTVTSSMSTRIPV